MNLPAAKTCLSQYFKLPSNSTVTSMEVTSWHNTKFSKGNAEVMKTTFNFAVIFNFVFFSKCLNELFLIRDQKTMEAKKNKYNRKHQLVFTWLLYDDMTTVVCCHLLVKQVFPFSISNSHFSLFFRLPLMASVVMILIFFLIKPTIHRWFEFTMGMFMMSWLITPADITVNLKDRAHLMYRHAESLQVWSCVPALLAF